MKKKVLMEHANRLITVISQSVRSATEGLAKSLRAYADDMEQSVKRSKERHKSTTSCHSHDVTYTCCGLSSALVALLIIIQRSCVVENFV